MIPQMEPWLGAEERAAVDAYLAGGGWITEFRETRAFEEEVAAFIGVRHAIAVTSGTTALTLAGLCLDLGPGDEVIVPDYTMIATANAFRLIGAEPVFVDIEPATLSLDLDRAEAAITGRTRAICLVNINGRAPSAGIDAFRALADRHGLALIEDAAQALGATFADGRHMGTVGDLGCLSFSSQKIVTTGQGGMVITNDDAHATRLRRLKDFGRERGGIDRHDSIGFNAKFTDLQACVGRAQLAKLPERVVRKRAMHARYREGLGAVHEVQTLPLDPAFETPWFIEILCEDRDGLQEALKAAGIGSRPMYPPLHSQPCYGRAGDYPVATRIGSTGLWLPSSAQLEDDAIDSVCRAIARHYGRA